MPPVPNREEMFLEKLFRLRRKDLMKSARVMVYKYGAKGLDVETRVEEAVQETMYEAWKQVSGVMEKRDPFEWLCGILKNKVYEQMREDNRWIRNLMYVPAPKEVSDPAELYERSGLRSLMSPEEYWIMLKIYHEGYSYEELSRELGISKTNLSTKISRIKMRSREKYEKI